MQQNSSGFQPDVAEGRGRCSGLTGSAGPFGAVWDRSEGTAGHLCPRAPVPSHRTPWAPRPCSSAPAPSEHLRNLPPLFLINCQCFFPLRTCSIWQQESTVGLAGTVVQSLEEFRIVTTHQNKLLSTDQNTKCCDSV